MKVVLVVDDGREKEKEGGELLLVQDEEPCRAEVGDVARGEKNNAP